MAHHYSPGWHARTIPISGRFPRERKPQLLVDVIVERIKQWQCRHMRARSFINAKVLHYCIKENEE
jgi:hypothetical protein